jgi:hypothetical protein
MTTMTKAELAIEESTGWRSFTFEEYERYRKAQAEWWAKRLEGKARI